MILRPDGSQRAASEQLGRVQTLSRSHLLPALNSVAIIFPLCLIPSFARLISPLCLLLTCVRPDSIYPLLSSPSPPFFSPSSRTHYTPPPSPESPSLPPPLPPPPPSAALPPTRLCFMARSCYSTRLQPRLLAVIFHSSEQLKRNIGFQGDN